MSDDRGQIAATEEALKKVEAFDKAVALSERRQTLLEEAEAERDTAVAAIERVRAIAERHGVKSWAEEIFAALDGAPEPEPIEWVYRARNSFLNSGAHASEETARATLQLMIDNHVFEVEPEPVFIERRPRFSWLPVEGERP